MFILLKYIFHLIVVSLAETIKTSQQENVVMFSRIMSKLNGEENTSLDFTENTDLRLKDMPFKQVQNLVELNQQCTDKPNTRKLLVSSRNRI